MTGTAESAARSALPDPFRYPPLVALTPRKSLTWQIWGLGGAIPPRWGGCGRGAEKGVKKGVKKGVFSFT
jgi:hypothetical protein